MANPLVQNGNRPHEPEEPISSRLEDFTEDLIPEQLQDDFLVGYLRCRYSERGAFLSSTVNEFLKKRVIKERKKLLLASREQMLPPKPSEIDEKDPVILELEKIKFPIILVDGKEIVQLELDLAEAPNEEAKHHTNRQMKELQEMKELARERRVQELSITLTAKEKKEALAELGKIESLKEKEEDRIVREMKRIMTLRTTYGLTPENRPIIEEFEDLRASWRNEALSRSSEELGRVDERVARMSKNLCPDQQSRRRDMERKILRVIRDTWQKVNLPPKPLIGNSKPDSFSQDDEKKSCFARLLQRSKTQEPVSPKSQNRLKTKHVTTRSPPRNQPSDSYGISVSKITLRKSAPPCSSSFMDYEIKRYPLNDVLYKAKDNPLTETCEKNTLRYFHFPSNNMHWIEEAISRYYGEETPGEYNYRQHDNYRQRSSNILCREYWSSLQHGGKYDPIHARHMRAHCALIRPETGCTTGRTDVTKNFVLFMPYLHWETHKRRKQMAEVTSEITAKYREKEPHSTEILRDDFTETVQNITNNIKLKHPKAMTGFTRRNELDGNNHEPKRERKLLGRYFLQIAKIYDAMDIEPDVRMLRDHLHQNPPLHSRRTLDQSYYWKLPNTNRRDEDQVVYRATRQGKHISRTTRVVMVDQLWLYILDDNTVITSFPRRWGRNKPDYSGVHKNIRATLDHLREGQLNSVYDLALIIINQCSTVFFDRTKPVDERPELLDIFSDALSHISGMKTDAFEAFWRHLDKLSANERQPLEFETIARAYLKINPEGKLLKEVHDIIEELRMMVRIFDQQERVVRDFESHLLYLHDQEQKSTLKLTPSDGMLEVMVEIKNLLIQRNQLQQGDSNTGAHARKYPSENASPNKDKTNHGPQEDMVDHNSIPESTLHRAKQVVGNIELRKNELKEFEMNTVSISEQLKDLLALKQQQASIIEAKYALKRADESVTQGRSVMLFTIVTIIFLPLSFMTSVFGMNAKDFDSLDGNGNRMSLRHQFRLAFPISLGVIIISVSLAFSSWFRSLILFSLSVSWAWLTEVTGLRWIFDKLVKEHSPDDIYQGQQKLVNHIHSRRARKLAKIDIEKAKAVDAKTNGNADLGEDMLNGNATYPPRRRTEDVESGCLEIFWMKGDSPD